MVSAQHSNLLCPVVTRSDFATYAMMDAVPSGTLSRQSSECMRSSVSANHLPPRAASPFRRYERALSFGLEREISAIGIARNISELTRGMSEYEDDATFKGR